MKNFWAFFVFIISFFTISYFNVNFAFAQNEELLPVKVELTEKEKKVLNSLSPEQFQKLIKTIELIIASRKNLQIKTNPQSTPQFSSLTTQNPSIQTQPTIYGNSPSKQTPFFNPSTGNYQSTPPPSSSGANNFTPQTNPFLQQSTGQTSGVFGTTQEPSQTTLGALAQGVTRGIQQAQIPPGGSVDLSNLNVPEFCKSAPDFGGTPAGKCFDMQNTTAKVKETVALACAAINKKLPIVSASRSGHKCGNAGGPAHPAGTAVDIGFVSLSSTDRQKVFEVFYKKGFSGYGCYGANSTTGVHLDHYGPRRWGPCKSSSCWSPSHCPQELFLAGYAR
jgi:hypothetical protein